MYISEYRLPDLAIRSTTKWYIYRKGMETNSSSSSSSSSSHWNVTSPHHDIAGEISQQSLTQFKSSAVDFLNLNT
jgi:hypothetical protein